MSQAPHELRAGDLVVRPQEHRAYVREVELSLTPREFEVLTALVARPGWVFSPEQLASALEPADSASPDAVNVHVSHLRGKLTSAGAPAVIETVRGSGWRLRRPRNGALAEQRTRPFVGRERELDTLAEILSPGAGRFALVTGEPGVGKTSLIEQYIAATTPRYEVVRAVCDSSAGTYWLWIQLLRAIESASGLPMAEHPDAALLARLLGDTLPAGAPTLQGVDRSLAFEALRSYLGAAAHASARPLLVFIDDLQWAADGSLALLGHILQRLPEIPCGIVAACRDIEARVRPALAPIVDYASQRRDAGLLTLGGLTGAEVATLLQVACPAEGGTDLAASLLERTAGNPLYLHEYLRVIVEGSCSDDTLDRTVAGSVASLVRGQIAALPGPTQDALLAGALMGGRFDGSLAAEAVGGGPDVFDVAGEADVVTLTADGLVTFRHALVRDALLEGVPEPDRARLHRRIAEVLRSATARGRGRQPFDLALHYAAAGPEARPLAVGYALASARIAASRFAFEDAATYLEQALPLVDPERFGTPRADRLRSIILERHGGARSALGDAAGAAALYEAALAARPSIDVMAQVRLLTRLGYVRALLREETRCFDAYERALAILERAEERGAAWWHAWLEVRLADIEAVGLMDVNRPLEAFRDVEAIVEFHGTREQQAKYYAKLAQLLCAGSERWYPTGEAIACAERAVRLAQDDGDEFLRGYALSVLGSLLVFADRHGEAAEGLRQALELTRRSSDVIGTQGCLLFLATAMRLSLDVLGCERYARELERMSGDYPTLPEFPFSADAHLGWVALRRGDLSEAAGRSARAIEGWLREPAASQSVWMAAWPAVACALAVGDQNRALECAALMARRGQQHLQDEMSEQLDAVVALERHGDARSATRLLEGLLVQAREYGYV